ncbi:MAG: DUF2975 domain-containing protein [Ruminococcaceae bacterium]|nr:DUF2975 domain-containing protein [Oscillospiraceae bacterium]
MLKISTKLSNTLSLVIAVIFFLACIVCAFFLPTVVNMLIDTPDNIGNREAITQFGRVFVHIVSYVLLAVFTLADALLMFLLIRVRKGYVFTPLSVSLIRGVSWCLLLVCVAFALLGAYFQLAFIMAFLAMFLGICLRVVKNVIEEATEIKSENDLTV